MMQPRLTRLSSPLQKYKRLTTFVFSLASFTQRSLITPTATTKAIQTSLSPVNQPTHPSYTTMALRTLFKYGVPFSFLYCTIYQQNVWREGDEMLFAEQRRVWRDFISMIDTGYHNTMTKLNLSSEQHKSQPVNLLTKLDSLDIGGYWNAKVLDSFASIDRMVSNPKVIACKLYRKVQSYTTTASSTTPATSVQTKVDS